MRKPILYKHRGAWYARFWNETDKKYHSRALGIKVEGKTERRSAAYEAALKLAPEMTGPIAKNVTGEKPIADILLLEYAESFWQSDSEYVKEKALLDKKPLSYHYLLTNREMIKNKMRPFEGFQGLSLKELSKPIIRQWKLWLAEQGYSGRTINGALLALRVPVKRAFFDDLIPTDPFNGVPRAAHKEKTRGILTPAEIKTLVDKPAADPRVRLAVYFPLYCSMRMGEVRGLRWGDISDGVIHIQHNWQEKEKDKDCKCGSEGYVPMPRVVAELLNRLHDIAPCTGHNDFVMAIRPYKPICREYLWESLKKELLDIGIDEAQRKERNIVYHSLRHSFVTACRIAGLTDFETMTLSRHKDTKMLQRYSHGKEAIDIKGIGLKFEQSLIS